MTDCICNHKSGGWCPRYRLDMTRRMREVCAGINVDLGASAAFRQQWALECGSGPISARRLLLRTNQAPGDAVAMTAAIYSLHKAHPKKYLISVESPYPEVFQYNPDVVPVRGSVSLVEMHYPAINQSNDRAIHFMQAWCEYLGNAVGITVPLLTNRPRLYFPGPAPSVEDFWLVSSGGKSDFTTKLWGQDRYQEVVNRLRGRVRFIQVGSSAAEHPRLDGVEYVVGKTSLRELFDLVRRSRGVLCCTSLLMHVAAALEKPAVVIAGGREPVAWNAYPLQQYVHTVGALPCRDARGKTGGACWRYRVIPLGDNTIMDRNTCEYPNGVPECMSIIHPEQVAELVLRYNNAT